jgi:hypothetical protein
MLVWVGTFLFMWWNISRQRNLVKMLDGFFMFLCVFLDVSLAELAWLITNKFTSWLRCLRTHWLRMNMECVFLNCFLFYSLLCTTSPAVLYPRAVCAQFYYWEGQDWLLENGEGEGV